MVGRQRAVVRGERCAAGVAQLVRVQFDRHSQRLAALEQSPDLCIVKRNRFAIGIDGIGQFVLCDPRQQLIADQFDVFVGPIRILRRDRMRGQQCRLQPTSLFRVRVAVPLPAF